MIDLSLILFIAGNKYRWKEADPFGSDAFCNAIAYVKFGIHHLEIRPLRVTAKQLAWFAYIMHLAMDGNRNMKENELHMHKREMKTLKRFIIEQQHQFTRIEVVGVGDSSPIHDVLGENVGADDFD